MEQQQTQSKAAATATPAPAKKKAAAAAPKAEKKNRAVVIELPAHITTGVDAAAKAAGRRPGDLFERIRERAERAVAEAFDKVTPYMIAAEMVEEDIRKQREESERRLAALTAKTGGVQ